MTSTSSTSITPESCCSTPFTYAQTRVSARQFPPFLVLGQAADVLNRAIPPPSTESSPDGCTKALRSLLSPPSAPPLPTTPAHRYVPRSASRLQTTSSSRSVRSTGTLRSSDKGVPRVGPAGIDATSAVTYRAFLERLTLEDSKGFVTAIRLFLFSIFGPNGDAPVSARPQARDWAVGRGSDDVEVYGTVFLVER